MRRRPAIPRALAAALGLTLAGARMAIVSVVHLMLALARCVGAAIGRPLLMVDVPRSAAATSSPTLAVITRPTLAITTRPTLAITTRPTLAVTTRPTLTATTGPLLPATTRSTPAAPRPPLVPLALAAALLLPTACAPTHALVDGTRVSRLDLDFVGQPFVVRLTAAHPRPGSPSGGLRDFGGRISGNVCGIEVTYDVQHLGDHTHLTGFLDDGAFESQLDVRDENDFTRVVTGSLTDRGDTVQLDIRKNHIRGNVGLRAFALARRGDQYRGWVRISQSVLAPATIDGADELWTLPPAAQAAVLPSLLTCYGDALEDHLGGTFVVGFGGRQTWEARHVSSIYHGQNDVARTVIQGSSSGQQPLGGAR